MPDQQRLAAADFRVVVRLRPNLLKETKAMPDAVHIDQASKTIKASMHDELGPGPTYTYQFDDTFQPQSSQKYLYDRAAKPAVASVLQGFNSSIIAYGQTGAGKTYTMEGGHTTETHGIIPRAFRDVFDHIERGRFDSPTRFLVRAAYLEIYNEVVSDLLKPGRTNLAIREDKRRGVYVENLTEWVARSPEEAEGLLRRGAELRATASTAANQASSRSHAVFILVVEQSEKMEVGCAEPSGGNEVEDRERFRCGKLFLVDLAGSERLSVTGASGKRLQECKKINGSLAALGNVISALTDAKRPHVPYRDSKLTRLLQDSIGGNTKTTVVACITASSMSETISTLKFGARARHVHNSARINEDGGEERSRLRALEHELIQLRAQLAEREKSVVDTRRYLEYEAELKRSEADRLDALRALEARSREVLREKEANAMLAETIARMEGQYLERGGRSIENPLVTRLSSNNLDQGSGDEANNGMDPNSPMDLVSRQRKMISMLKQRLSERDSALRTMQEERVRRDMRVRELEDSLDRKTAQLIHLQRVLTEKLGSAALAESNSLVWNIPMDDGRDDQEPSVAAQGSICKGMHDIDGELLKQVSSAAEFIQDEEKHHISAHSSPLSPNGDIPPSKHMGIAQRKFADELTRVRDESRAEIGRVKKQAEVDIRQEKAAHAQERQTLIALLDGKATKLLERAMSVLREPIHAGTQRAAVSEVRALHRLIAAASAALKLPEAENSQVDSA